MPQLPSYLPATQTEPDPARNFRFRQYGTSSPLVNGANSEVINNAIKNATPSVDLFAAAGRAKTAIPAQQPAAPPEQVADITAQPKDSPVGEKENTINSGIPQMQDAARRLEHATDPSKYVQDYDKAVQNARTKGDIASSIDPSHPTPDVKPSLGRQIGAVAAGVGTGLLTMNPLAGLGMYQGISRMPAQEKQYQAERVSDEADKQAAQQGKLAEEARAGVATNIAQGAAEGVVGKEMQAAAQYGRTGEAAAKAKTAADEALAAQRRAPQPVIGPPGSLIGTRAVDTGIVTPQMTVPNRPSPIKTTNFKAPGESTAGVYVVNEDGSRGNRLGDVPTTTRPQHEWVIRNGKITEIEKGTTQAGDQPYDAVAERSKISPIASEYEQERARRTVASVDELLNKVSGFTTGAGSILAHIPGTDARNFQAQLETLKSGIISNELTQMRHASKSGGALGQISDKEDAFLSAALGALDPGQSPENFKEQLQKIKASITRWQDAQKQYALPDGGGKSPDDATIDKFLESAGGDPTKAHQLLTEHNWKD